MKISLPFGNRWVEAEFPEHAKTISPGYGFSKLSPVENQEKEILNGISYPLDTEPLRNVAKKGWKITIAFDDPTVPCYAPVWNTALKATVRELKAAGVDMKDVSLLCANALHRKFRIWEVEKILGDVVKMFSGRIYCHDAEDRRRIVKLGETQDGYPVEINRAVADSDLTIYVNTFASAFNGGWKSICVGLATWETIRCHHTPDYMSMSAERNMMHDILNRMGEVVKSEIRRDIFKIETVMANPLQVHAVFSGTIDRCREEVLKIWRRRAKRRRDLLKEKVDVVCYGVPEWSPYAAFSKMNPVLTLLSTGLGYLGGVVEGLGKKGCDVILATPCPDQWDRTAHAPYPEIWEILGDLRDPYEIMERYENHFASHTEYISKYRNHYSFHPVHGLMATFPLKRLKHAGRVIVAGIENPKLAEHIGFLHAPTVEDAVEMAQEQHGKDASIAVVKYPMIVSRQ
ncbi:lactate racemase domain-containing protein [Archaeoglobus neptunius]|uniref:lactate racemase domain-containing protein n=1 Tax=Archaeoglobus neptunius TaxID=2798580 RepID=UPI001928DDCE|nr:lactate racemase domain-containing protein [Archaeoglobus neptunius]